MGCTLPISPSLLPWGPLAPPHGTSPKSSWCMWLVGNPVYEPCTSGPHIRAPKWPTGTLDKGHLEGGPPATASFSLPLLPEPFPGFPPWPGPPAHGP